MNCAVHSEIAATGFCRNCGKAMCATCTRDVRGILYCEDCLASTVAAPPAAASGPSPALAAVLGVIPGLGAVYNGEYLKALIHVLLFGTMIALMDRADSAEAFFVPLFIAFIFYMPIEAYRTAKARAEGRTPTSLFGETGATQPVGAYLLIALGVLFMIEQSGVPVFAYAGRFVGPLLLIGLGFYLIRRRAAGGSGGDGTSSSAPGSQP
jgi:hypothetical protein